MRAILRTISVLSLAAIALTGCDAAPREGPVIPSADSAETAKPGTPLRYEALVALIGDPDDFAKARKLGDLLPTLGPDALPAVKDVLENAAMLELGATEFGLLMHYWARHAPGDAAFYAFQGAPRGYRVSAIHATVRPWARSNPQQALETVRVWTLEQGDGGAATQIALVRGWYESGQPGLEEYIRDLGAGFERQRALATYAQAVIRKHGVDALARWAEGVPAGDGDDTYQLELYRKVASAMVPFDVEAAKRFCDAHCDDAHGVDLRSEIAARWARDDPAAALDWLASSPKSQDTSFAARIVYSIWGSQDRAGAMRWFESKTAGELPEWVKPTIPVHARLLAKESPAEGLAWATKLEDDRDRAVLTVELAHGWYQKDRAAAEAWLAQSSLSPELREIVRSPEPPRIRGSFSPAKPTH